MRRGVRRIAITLALAVALSATPQAIPFMRESTNVEAAKTKVTYKLSKKGVLTISGTGKMPKSMTFKKNKKIKKVVIKKGVTKIPAKAFYGCKNLKSVKIAKTVKTIGVQAFMNTSLKEVVIPKGVKNIGEQAFYIKSLKKITMPGYFRFMYNDNDDGIYDISRNVEEIILNTNLNKNYVREYNTDEITVCKDDPKFTSIDGLIYSKDKKTLKAVPNNRKIVEVAEGCENVYLKAFWLTMTLDSADDRSKVTKLILPSSVKKFRYSKTEEYYDWNIKSLNNLKEIDIKSTKLDNGSIRQLIELTSYSNVLKENLMKELVENGYNIDENGFYIKDNVIGAYFGNADKIVIPDGITKIDDWAFYNNQSITEVTIPSTVKEIGRSAFYMCKNLSVVHMNEGLNIIRNGSFVNTKLSTITIPEGVTTIEFNAFAETNIKEITLPESIKEVSVGSSPIEKVTFPKTMTKIPEGMFMSCSNLKEIEIPAHITEIGNSAFSGCGSLEKVEIKGNIIEISEGAFAYCPKLETVIFPNTVKAIGREAFHECNSLKTVGDISNVTEIGDYAFYGCIMYNAPIGNKVVSIGEYAFDNNGHKQIIIPTNVKTITKNAFGYGAKSLSYEGGIENSKIINGYMYINYNYSKNKSKLQGKWDEIKGASGYQIAFYETGKKVVYKNVKKNSLKIELKGYKNTIKIRPYKKVNGKKVYGKWSDEIAVEM